MTSVYTSRGGEWRLGGFEILSSMKEDDGIIYVGVPPYLLVRAVG